MEQPIYLDYNSTTPVDPEVLQAMLPFFTSSYGNPAAITHSYGWEARQAIDLAKKQVAQLLIPTDDAASQLAKKNIIWTSGATESINIALFGTIRSFLKQNKKAHLITTDVEHKAVITTVEALKTEGIEVTYLKSDLYGRVTAQQVAAAIRPHTRLISIIMGQNEIGTINPILDIGAVAREHNILFHVDAAQSFGKIEINVQKMNVDFLSASGHKIYAPKGIGILYAKEYENMEPILFGGNSQLGLRPGTINTAGAVAFGKASDLCRMNLNFEMKRLTSMRDAFIEKILSEVPGSQLNGHPIERLSTNISLSFSGLSTDIFSLGMNHLAISSGSSCSSGESSHVLEAIGLSPALARATIRIGIGRFTTENDLKVASDIIISKIRENLKLTSQTFDNI
ncbi:MAG: cysteine desulfurase family protein [Bdellovibrionales bacterium]